MINTPEQAREAAQKLTEHLAGQASAVDARVVEERWAGENTGAFVLLLFAAVNLAREGGERPPLDPDNPDDMLALATTLRTVADELAEQAARRVIPDGKPSERESRVRLQRAHETVGVGQTGVRPPAARGGWGERGASRMSNTRPDDVILGLPPDAPIHLTWNGGAASGLEIRLEAKDVVQGSWNEVMYIEGSTWLTLRDRIDAAMRDAGWTEALIRANATNEEWARVPAPGGAALASGTL
jgi:hypothetical protein